MKDQEEREADAVLDGLEGTSGMLTCSCGRVLWYTARDSRLRCVCGAVWDRLWHWNREEWIRVY